MKQFKFVYTPTFRNNLFLKHCVFVRSAESLLDALGDPHHVPDTRDWILDSVEELAT